MKPNFRFYTYSIFFPRSACSTYSNFLNRPIQFFFCSTCSTFMPSFPWFHSSLWCFLFSRFLQKHGCSETLKWPQSINGSKAIVAGGDISSFADVQKFVGDMKRNRSWKNDLFFWKNYIGISLVLPHSNSLFSSTYLGYEI